MQRQPEWLPSCQSPPDKEAPRRRVTNEPQGYRGTNLPPKFRRHSALADVEHQARDLAFADMTKAEQKQWLRRAHEKVKEGSVLKMEGTHKAKEPYPRGSIAQQVSARGQAKPDTYRPDRRKPSHSIEDKSLAALSDSGSDNPWADMDDYVKYPSAAQQQRAYEKSHPQTGLIR